MKVTECANPQFQPCAMAKHLHQWTGAWIKCGWAITGRPITAVSSQVMLYGTFTMACPGIVAAAPVLWNDKGVLGVILTFLKVARYTITGSNPSYFLHSVLFLVIFYRQYFAYKHPWQSY